MGVPRREQFHALRLGENLDLLNPAVKSFLAEARPAYLQQTADPVAATRMAWQTLSDLRQQQASMLAYIDDFWLMLILTLLVMPLIFLIQPPSKNRAPAVDPQAVIE